MFGHKQNKKGEIIKKAFLKSGLIFAILQLSRKDSSLVKGLQSWDIGLAQILAPCFVNLPDKLLIPNALDGLKSFKRSNVFFSKKCLKKLKI